MLRDFVLKFIYCYVVYCDINLEVEVKMGEPCREAGAAYGVVMKMLYGHPIFPRLSTKRNLCNRNG
jgi:hypothetical protein